MRHDVRVPWMMDPTPHYAAEYFASLLSQSGKYADGMADDNDALQCSAVQVPMAHEREREQYRRNSSEADIRQTDRQVPDPRVQQSGARKTVPVSALGRVHGRE